MDAIAHVWLDDFEIKFAFHQCPVVVLEFSILERVLSIKLP
jgi:hypothetical protein